MDINARILKHPKKTKIPKTRQDRHNILTDFVALLNQNAHDMCEILYLNSSLNMTNISHSRLLYKTYNVW